MQDGFGLVLFVLLLFWIPAISFMFRNYIFAKTSEVVIGKVVDIEPVFRVSKYVFEINYNGTIETTTIYPNTSFQKYRINDTVKLYRKRTREGLKYKVTESLYTVSLVAMGISAFFFLMMLGAL